MSSALRGVISRVPRVTEQFTPSNASFALPSFSGKLSGYAEAVTTVPITLVVIGWLAVLFLQLFLCLRCCLPSMKCAAVQSRRNQRLGQFRAAVRDKRRTLLFLASVFGLLCACSVHAVFYANSFLTSALTSLESTLTFLINLATSLSGSSGQVAVDDAQTVLLLQAAATSAPSAACRNLSQTILNNAGNVSGTAESIASLLSSTKHSLDSADSLLTGYGSAYQSYFVFGYYSASMSLLLSMAVGLACQLKGWLQLYIGLSELFVLLLSLVVGGLLAVLMVLSDFCAAPYSLLADVVVSNGSVHDLVAYYGSCNGTDPFAADLSLAQSAVQALAGNVSAAVAANGSCPSEPHLLQSQSFIADMGGQIAAMNASLACHSLSGQLHGLVDEGVCSSLFEGLFIVAVTFLGTSALLFALVCVVSVLYQFFGSLWTMGAGGNRVGDEELPEDDDVDEDDEVLKEPRKKP